MNNEMRNPLARAAASTAAVLAMLAAILGFVGAAPAHAASGTASVTASDAASTRYGYEKVTTRESYLTYYLRRDVQILHLDDDHMDPDGFWFAARSSFQQRGYGWIYQPYGLWCGDANMKVAFNGWMNTDMCVVDMETVGAAYPAYPSNTAACRASTGQPWKAGSAFAGDSGCVDSALDWSTNPVIKEGSREYTCAPWEPQGLDQKGAALCNQTHYAWENETPNTFWMPAPDTCTGMPADSNRGVQRDPAAYVPASGDGSCTGSALAPNCPADSIHQGCTGIDPADLVWATATAAATSTQSANATLTRSASARVLRGTVTETASRKYKGKTYSASASAKFFKEASASMTATVTSTGTGSATATMSCASTTVAKAQDCAAKKAQVEAQRLADVAAQADAASKARDAAGSKASADASAAATQTAQKASASTEKAAAVEKARKAAQAKVDKIIANL